MLGYAGIPVNVNGSPARLPVHRRRGRGRVPPAGPLLRLRRLGPRPVHGPLARRPVRAAFVGQRRQAAERRGDHEELSSRAPDDRRASVTDATSGVDPLSLQLLLRPSEQSCPGGATLFDPETGIAVFSIPREALPARSRDASSCRCSRPTSRKRRTSTPSGKNPLPNSRFQGLRAKVVNRPTVTWITPEKARLPRGAPAAAGDRERQRPRSPRSGSSTATGRSAASARTSPGSTS